MRSEYESSTANAAVGAPTSGAAGVGRAPGARTEGSTPGRVATYIGGATLDMSGSFLRLLGKMLREARDCDVWLFVTPRDVASELPALARHLGRRRAFWDYLIRRWRGHGFVP